MATTLTTRRSSQHETRNRDRVLLKLRTHKIFSQEIGFIPNVAFREMDADGYWKRELDTDVIIASHHVSSGRLTMPAHLQQLCSTPLLSNDQERDLFCRLNYLKYRANVLRSTLNSDRPSAKKVEQIEALLERANTLRNWIVKANTRLVMSIVSHFADDKNPFDELLSEGIECLLKAVEKFDYDRGYRFSTYATMAIRREVFRLIQRTHRDHKRFTTGTSAVLDEQIDTHPLTGRTEAALTTLNHRIAGMLDRLDEREQFIVKARYGLTDIGNKPTFSRLGNVLGISKERVRQLEMRAMSKLRDLTREFRLASVGPF